MNIESNQPLIVALYSTINVNPPATLISWLPSLVSALNQQLVSRSVLHLSKYSYVLDKCFQVDAAQATNNLNNIRFKLLIQLISIVESDNDLKDLLKFIYRLQNMIKFSESQLVLPLLIKAGNELEAETQKYVVLVIVKSSLYKPELINSCLANNINIRYFGQMFLNILNNSSEDYQRKNLLKFIISVYSNTSEFFYNNDLKVLVDIILRILEHGSSKQITQKVLQCYITLSCSDSFQKFKKYRNDDLKEMISLYEQKQPELKNIIKQVQTILDQ